MPKNLYELEKRLVECESTSCIMDILFEAGLLNIEQSKFLYTNPPKINPVYFKKVEGILIGTVIGDVLGSRFESKTPDEVLKRYGEIKA
ncbi:MAG: ADP-ribosylglycohydrolase family protein, partial [Thermococcus sp.]|nr:ADP-ribosylglycohydrolase family protein [Thermococcus sp.]